MRRRAAVLVGLIVLGAAAWAEPSPEAVQLFLEGNGYYEAGDFSRAAVAYRRCYDAGCRGADVLYNLGNAYARQGRIGRALAAYHGARRLAPRDADLLANIERVSSLRSEQMPALPRGWLASVFGTVVSRYTLNEWTALALLALAVAAVLGTVALRRRRPSLRLTLCVAAAVLPALLAGAALYSRYEQDYLHPRAFVAVAAATMRSGPGEHFEVTGTLADGTAVTPVSDSGLWADVRLQTGKRAWVRRSDLSHL